jgi:hypothetical protein
MILNVIEAEYLKNYEIILSFDNGEKYIVDLKNTIFNETRKIFQPLKDPIYFKNFEIKYNTITWENEADFAPEFLLELGKSIN